jgi:hypothetical protein
MKLASLVAPTIGFCRLRADHGSAGHRGRWPALLLAAGALAPAQQPAPTYIPQTKFARGQDVVPSFDGWMKNADGSFTMVFGYMNRNYEEEPAIPAGPDNKIEPGVPDRGQPTYFLPRRHAWMFRVTVPSDWGNQELVWTITANGRAEKAYGSLKSDEEISERLIRTRGNLNPGLDDPNQPPSIEIAPVSSAVVGQPVALVAHVTDDGLPKPRVPKARPEVQAGKGQTNSATARPRIGLAVTWSPYRGPAKVTFDDSGPIAVSGGQAVTNVRFTVPGTYVLRATANDGALSVSSDIAIQVK